MVNSAASPLKFAPQPMLVGAAMIGAGVKPPITAGNAIGIYIRSNTGEIHSPATFTLEVQRDI